MRSSPKVYLIGAGPGDRGLITVKGLERLRAADVILYDSLINTELLKEARPGAALIHTGKRSGEGSKLQKRIHALILKFTRRGKSVARLKGGDPFLFGRGGEEIKFLAKHKLRFEVIPGVTSALGAAAYTGIPLTERNSSSSVAFITGHEAFPHDARAREKHMRLCQNAETLVVYMGVKTMPRIAAKLLSEGLNPRLPCAIVECATWGNQRSFLTRLQSLKRTLQKNRVASPALLIVGRTASFIKKHNWFEKLPLFGKTLLLLRPSDRVSHLRERLEGEGACVIGLPALQLVAWQNGAALKRGLTLLPAQDWVLFTSVAGVEFFFEMLKQNKKDARFLGSVRVAAIGSATEEALKSRGIRPDFVPKRFTTLGLARDWNERAGPLKDKQLLLLRSRLATHELESDLKRFGAIPTRLDAYTAESPKGTHERIRLLEPARLDMIIFTSASTVDFFARSLTAGQRARMKRVRMVSIGPVTSRAIRRYGWKVWREASPYNDGGILKVILGKTA